MRLGALLAGILGLGISIWLLGNFGFAKILALLTAAGWWGIFAVLAFHPLQVVCSALGWRDIAGPSEPKISLRTYLELRWTREAVNNLLPLAQIGGEFVASRMLQRRGVKLAFAVAGTTADFTVELASQVVFTCVGVLLLVNLVVDSHLARYMTLGLVGAALVLVCMGVAFWFGLAALIEKALLRLGRHLQWSGAQNIDGLHDALMASYRSPRRFALAMLWHLISWFLGGIEVCIALHFLGHDVDIGTGMVIESLGQAAKSLGFAIPGALAVQEGGYILVCGLFGLPPDVALALSLLKRLREIVLGIPGLIFWHHSEKATGVRDVPVRIGPS
jgi:putative membrane protein